METPSVSRCDQDFEEDKIVTMVDVLKEETELEEDANAVLGGADDKTCTYTKGYVLRQPLYACTTCSQAGNGKLAGICLACSYHCHDGHELTELYTKRNFRCDCGNSLFPTNACTLEPGKDMLNEKNQYNQNFKGLYCTCSRPYPDPDDTVVDEMIQCILCEDWFHKRHLGITSTNFSDFGEMICLECMKKHSFLWKYRGLCIRQVQNESSDDGRAVEVDSSKQEDCRESEEGKQDEKQVSCKLIDARGKENETGSTFWPDGWRKNLCRCVDCLKLYEEKQISFLLNETDTVQYYEARNKEHARETQYEKGLKALSSLGRMKQVEALKNYNHMQTELIEYLQKFAENKKVVREEDIWEFFDQMRAKKKPKIEIPHFCR